MIARVESGSETLTFSQECRGTGKRTRARGNTKEEKTRKSKGDQWQGQHREKSWHARQAASPLRAEKRGSNQPRAVLLCEKGDKQLPRPPKCTTENIHIQNERMNEWLIIHSFIHSFLIHLFIVQPTVSSLCGTPKLDFLFSFFNNFIIF